MIINGEKTPAFSATTLSIPKPSNDITPRIVRNSRLVYARSREEVESEIRANIEAAEKWKKDLSDSGRAAGEHGSQPKEKPSYAFVPTPQADFRKQKISPNAAEGGDKSGNGLKDLSKLLGEKARRAESEQQKKEPQQLSSPNIKTTVVEDELEENQDKSVEEEIVNNRPIITSGNHGSAVVTPQNSNQNNKNHKKRNRNKNKNKNRS